MPSLRSLSGFSMLRRYVRNWPSVLAVYFHAKGRTTAIFRDGQRIPVSMSEYSAFYEKLYRQHNVDHGISYIVKDGSTFATLPNSVLLELLDEVDSRVLDEVYVERVYDFVNFENKVVIDVGASFGDTAVHFASEGATVYGFEPNPIRCELAMKNIRANRLESRVTLSASAVSSVDQIAPICQENGSKEVILKLDCEGCEFGVLTGVLPKNVCGCVLEYHDNPTSLVRTLTSQGFRTVVRKRRTFGMIYARRVANGVP